MSLLFWSCAIVLGFSYVGYLAALAFAGLMAGKGRSAAAREFSSWPGVSAVLTVFNEERIIASKIENFFSCKYRGPREMVIVSDGSTDRTVEIIRRFEGEQMRLIAHPGRRGKDLALADAVRESHGEILIFTDAGAMFAEDALEELVRPFMDPDVCLVSGVASYAGAESANLYRRYEDWLKSLEAKLGVLSGALGPMYAIRRASCRPKDLQLFNDFADAILVALDGNTATLATAAVCRQNRSEDGHWARQVRNVSCAAAVLFHYLPRLLTKRRWKAALVLVTHKLLRWLTLPLLILMAVAAWTLRDAGGVYRTALILGAAFPTAAAVGLLAEKAGLGRRLRVAYDFFVTITAWSVGLGRCLTGRVPVVWQPRGL